MGSISTARVVALLSGVAIVIGSIGPWQTKFLFDQAGTDGDGIITLLFALIGVTLVLFRPPGSKWLWIASALGLLCSIVAFGDLLDITGSQAQLFAPEVTVASPGWGIWLTAVASVSFLVSAYWRYADKPESERDSTSPSPSARG